jgi:hypothetical protein
MNGEAMHGWRKFAGNEMGDIIKATELKMEQIKMGIVNAEQRNRETHPRYRPEMACIPSITDLNHW